MLILHHFFLALINTYKTRLISQNRVFGQYRLYHIVYYTDIPEVDLYNVTYKLLFNQIKC